MESAVERSAQVRVLSPEIKEVRDDPESEVTDSLLPQPQLPELSFCIFDELQNFFLCARAGFKPKECRSEDVEIVDMDDQPLLQYLC
jgi:Rad3-related DNA helicase